MNEPNGSTRVFLSLIGLIITIIGCTVAIVQAFESVRHDHAVIMEKLKPCSEENPAGRRPLSRWTL